MVFSAISAAYISTGVAFSAIAAWWARAYPRIAIYALLGSLAIGQIGRLVIAGQGGGLLVSDIAVVLTIGVATIIFLENGWREYQLSRSFLLTILPFLAWSFFTLVIHIPKFGVSAAAVAGAYWLRLATDMMLLPALLVLFKVPAIRRATQYGWRSVVYALIFIGFLQLIIVPKLGSVPSIVAAGWDPHINRLVTTWFDPNFIGAFFGMALIFVGLKFFDGHTNRSERRWLSVIFLLTSTALAFTASRSSLVALIVTIAVMSVIVVLHLLAFTKKDKKTIAVRLVVVASLVGVIGIGSIALLGHRFTSFFFDDPTVQLRVVGLQAVWNALAPGTAFIGVGYNAYQFAAIQGGLINSFEVHSRAGADNSFLTLWITTGIIGIVLFFLPWIQAVLLGWQRAWRQGRLIGFAPLALLIFLGVHAQFVNSFLYSHLLITFVILICLTVTDAYDY